jgi:hypothetical protein
MVGREEGDASPAVDVRRALEPLLALARARPLGGCECARRGALWRVGLWGFLPADWCGNLSLHCAAAGVGIVEGDGYRLQGSRWAASLTLRPARAEDDLAAFDFLHMARRRPLLVPDLPPLRIEAWHLEPLPQEDSLSLWVRGRDGLGFLAGVLDAVSWAGLAPHAFSVRTRAGCAEDRFLLHGPGGSAPPARATERLRERLGRLGGDSP